MKTNETANTLENTPWLTPWQRRAALLVGAVAGALAAAALIRWLDCRRAARKATAKPSDAGEA
jgi:hypothetical protein